MSLSDTMFGMHVLGNSWNPNATAHQGVTYSQLIQLAAQAGSSIVRIPLDMSQISASNPSTWTYVVQDALNDLQAAASLGIKVIFEPGQTPLDLAPVGGTIQDAPDTLWGINELARRFGLLVQAVHDATPPQQLQYIAGWEVGNEPNLSYQYVGTTSDGFDPAAPVDAPRYWAVSLDNAELYATYLAAVAANVHTYNPTISVIGAGIAHNDPAYMEAMFAKLQALNASVDGFSVHPYTTYSAGAFNGGSPDSGRPTDWIGSPTADPWAHYFSFQGALYNMQTMINQYGFAGADIWVTEFGVPSYQGMRGAGAQGEIDQAYWYAEALGVFDSWGNTTLKGIVAHDVLDNYTIEQNAWYDAHDSTSTNDGNTTIAEGSFGLYKRSGSTGVISAKFAVDMIQAITDGLDYQNQYIRVLSFATTTNIDISGWGSSGLGIVGGYVVFTHGGNDTVSGSGYADSIFAGDGNDSVNGNDGDDRIYGGAGNDFLGGGNGNDDLYGNYGDDVFLGGAGTNHIDGGTGWDVLQLEGFQTDFTWSGDGSSLTVYTNGGWQTTYAINVEQIVFLANGVTINLANGNTSIGNGGLTQSSTPITIYGTAADDYLSGTSGNDIILGGAGNDQLYGGAGNDTLDGQSGTNNQVNYDGYVTDYTFVRNADGTITVTSSAYGLDTLSNINGFWFLGQSAWYSANQLAPGGPIYGTTADDYLNGTVGNDTILGGDGNDQLYGNLGNDYLDGQGGSYNQVNYDGSAADYQFSKNADGTISVYNSTYGTDKLSNINGLWFLSEAAWYSIDQLIPQNGNVVNGTSGNDNLVGTSGSDIITGGVGNDTITGGLGVDSLQGGAGNDRIIVDDTDSWYSGGDGVDTLVDTGTLGRQYSLSKGWFENAEMGSGNDTVWGNASVNNLLMGAGNDIAFGYDGNDVIDGGSGNDTLDGGIGSDTLIGGLGDDTFYVDVATDIVTELATAGLDTIYSSVTLTNRANVEKLILAGTTAISATGLDAWADTLIGNSAANSLFGLGGNDTLDGGAGSDTLIGGLGNDSYYVDVTTDIITETLSAGIDTIYSSVTLINRANVEKLILTGTAAINAIGLDAWADTLTGNSAANTLTGLAGNDILDGRAGSDTLVGGLGDDAYYVDVATDIVTELASAGTDSIFSSVSLTNRANVERLTLTGTAAINATGLDAWADILVGNSAANTLSGLGGNDVLDGGLGNDTLTGGAGSDWFRFSSSPNSTTNFDIITDFTHAVDDIQLTMSIFSAIGAGLDATELRLGTAAADANDYLVYNSATGQIFYDADGNGAGAQTLFAKVAIGTAIDFNDFILV